MVAQAGRKALADLRDFVATRNAAALASLDKAAESLITLHLLNVPATLHLSLLFTNVIENLMRTTRDRSPTSPAGEPRPPKSLAGAPPPCSTLRLDSIASRDTPITPSWSTPFS